MNKEADIKLGVLYVIATPIGNLADVSERMRETFSRVDCVYAEDTRHTRKLCQHLGIDPALRSLHDHNESDRINELLNRLRGGESLGLVSDAGTPLISDPGYKIVSACHQAGITVSPVAGPSSVIAALSVCGLPTDKFCFHGFLPAKSAARRALLQEVCEHESTSVFFESKHRIMNTLDDVCDVLGGQRQICVARELTKTFESVLLGEAAALRQQMLSRPDEVKGEFVLVVRGFESDAQVVSADARALLLALAAELPPRKAAGIVAEHMGANKKALYQWLISRPGD